MIEFKNISYEVHDKKIIKNFSLEIKENEITTIIGPNGSGKSTIVKLLNMKSKRYEGNIYYKNNLFNLKKDVKEIAILFQDNEIIDYLTVYDYIKLGLNAKGSVFKKRYDNEEDIEWVLKIFNLEKLRDKQLSKISGGQRQRVFIASVVVRKPKVLILDEPTTFLDVNYQEEILEIIRMLNTKYNMTILMVLHDINQALAFSDNLVILQRGRLRSKVKVDDINEVKMINKVFRMNFSLMEIKGKKILISEKGRKHA